ncbi:MAG TPA: MATE family efflux transporter [Sedimentibacter sp.]|nr:MATE family efflux transporter [Sedimentibacter sp.]HNZ83144.1 MATE family efflux transporter [Sedimentibacter sp.]HOH70057.1 MATE family efflux transporter [Sedimentibacter sp.]HQB62794.1 MATE family efflux transporter [Sedimentibacter sp.]
MEHTNPLGEEKVSKLLYKFSIPAIVGMMVNALYNIVDRIYIGNSPDLGANGIGGITISFPLTIILLSIGILFGQGGATLFSMNLGAKKHEGAQEALGNAFIMLILVGFSYMLLSQLFLVRLLKLFGASKTILPYAVEYMRYILFGSVFQVVSMGLNNFMRADGNPKLAMYTMFLGAGTNIVLDPVFIYGFKMGMAGAAIATVISQLFSFIWVVSYFTGKKSKVKLILKYIKPKFNVVFKILSLGLPGFSLQIANSLLNLILNKNLQLYGGDIAVSGMGVINSVQTMLIMPIIGLNQGVQPIISFNFGAKNYDRVKNAAKLAVKTATIVTTIGFVITRLFPLQIISLFNREPDMLEFGSHAIITWFLCLPVVGFQIIGANFFQALGRYKTSMFLTLTRQIIILIPSIIIFSKIWGIKGLVYAAPFADSLSFLLTASFFYYGIKHLENFKLI